MLSVTARWILLLMPAVFLSTDDSTAANASIPSELQGKWCENEIEFDAAGFRGASNSEGYRCDIMRISKVDENIWNADFVCEGEFGRAAIHSLIRLERFNGVAYLAMTQRLKHIQDTKIISVQPLTLRQKCK